MRRILSILALCALIAPAASSAAAEGAVWRSLIALPAPGSDDDRALPPLDRFVIGMQLGEVQAVEQALADSSWSIHLRAWSQARWQRQRGDLAAAAQSYHRAATRWPRTLEEPAPVLAAFDRERISLALERGDRPAAEAIAEAPLRAHDDPSWDAHRATLRLRQGDVEGARSLFDAAWQRATRVDRRDLAFAHRARAHLAAGDSVTAARSWIEFIDTLRRPEQLRAALAVWEAEPRLARVVRADERRRVVLDWLVRLFRREEARALAQRWIADADSSQRAELFVFVAEQSYRLRQDLQLENWLARTWPERLTPQDRAALEAYPLGVRRRTGHSEELARAFDAIADRHAPAPRAAEARWEAAWMWELSERDSTAVERYERYLEERSGGPFASAAALRAVFLRWRAEDWSGTVAAYERHARRFDDGLDGAAGLWLTSDALDRLGRVDEADRLRDQLRSEHPASPLWREDLALGAGEVEVEDRLSAYARAQAHAWEDLSEFFGEDLSTTGASEELQAIDRLAELGLVTEAEVRLADWAELHRADTLALARVCALAHRRGLPEMLGRQGWILERRLKDEGPAVGHAALVVSLPTPFARAVVELGRELDVAPELVWALMRRESFYDADVLSIAGAYGLLQLIPRTAGEMAQRLGLDPPTPQELFVPAVNLRLGIGYLAGLFAEADGDRVRALASYNAGESNGLRWQQRRRPGDPYPLGILVISFSETRAYVYHVLRLWHHYADAYGPSAP